MLIRKLTYKELREMRETAPEALTTDDMIRLNRIEAIPPEVFMALEKTCEQLRNQIMDLEAQRNAILDFLNGEG